MTYLLGRSQFSSQRTLEGSVLPCFGLSPNDVHDLDHNRSIAGTDLKILTATFCFLCELNFWFRRHNLYKHKLKVISQCGFILSSQITAVQIKLHAKKNFNLKKKKKTTHMYWAWTSCLAQEETAEISLEGLHHWGNTKCRSMAVNVIEVKMFSVYLTNRKGGMCFWGKWDIMWSIYDCKIIPGLHDRMGS